MAHTRQLAWLCALVGSIVSASAAAQPESKERAATLFEQGRAAMKAGDFGSACRAFRESERLDAAPGTVLNLALCSEQLGKLATALEYYRRVTAELPAADERAVFAAKQAAALEPRVPRLDIALDAALPAEASVAIDGVGVARSDLTAPVPLDPGRHRIDVRAPGHDDRSYVVDLDPRGVERIELSAGPRAKLADSGGSTLEGHPAASDGMSPMQIAGLTIGSAGVASLVVGGVLGVLVLDRKSTVEEQCDERFCDSQEGVDAAAEGAVFSTASSVTLALGAAALGGGIALFVLGSSDERSAALVARPSLAGGFIGLRGGF